MTETKIHEDFSPTGSNFEGLKFIGGLVQLGIGTLALVLNNYFFQEPIVELAGIACMGLGFFLLGVYNKVIVSPEKKSISVSRGFFVPIIHNTYYADDIDHIKITKQIRTERTGTDQNSIGPSRTNKLIISFVVKLVLRNQKTVKLHNEQDKNAVLKFAKRIVNELPIKGGLKREE